MMKIKGVNLGNWLVLEKWMSRELFHGIDAEDETDFYNALSPEEAADRLYAQKLLYSGAGLSAYQSHGA